MKLWLSKNFEIPMREQLVTQIRLGILSGDLKTGEKLPSRGEISRRFGIHANTVSNAYQKLTEKKLIEFRQGSGFFVCEITAENFDKTELDSLTAEFINNARSFGFSIEEIQCSFQKHLEKNSKRKILVIESDEPLRKILIEEIKEFTNAEVEGIGYEDFAAGYNNLDSIFVALSNEIQNIETVLSAAEKCFYIKTRSVPKSIKAEDRPAEDSLIAVVSGWKNFLQMAKTILIAAKIDADSIILRSTENKNWQRGLENVSLIICDSLTANEFRFDKRVKPFYLISDNSLRELHNLVK